MNDTPATPESVSETLAQAVREVFKDRPIVVAAALKQFSAALNNRFPGQQINVLTAVLKALRIIVSKSLPPNADLFEYLLSEHEVHIEEPTWTDKSTPDEKDFLLEYAILDSKSGRTRKVLWHAHFHCTARSVGSMVKAHLKLERLRFVTVRDQLVASGGKTEGIIYPGNMKTNFAKRYFFDVLPPSE
jgi:hypothetical protein